MVLGFYINIKLEDKTLKYHKVLITDTYGLKLPLNLICTFFASWEIRHTSQIERDQLLT